MRRKLTSELKQHYDFIVCGSGSSGSVVGRRLAENPDVSVLLLEAGGSDDVPEVVEAGQWPMNLGSERDWSFQAQPNPHLNGRAIPMDMGKVLRGGSSIHAMAWARGHKADWDFLAAAAGDAAWNYESVLEIYRRIEDWQRPRPKVPRNGRARFCRARAEPRGSLGEYLEGRLARRGTISRFSEPVTKRPKYVTSKSLSRGDQQTTKQQYENHDRKNKL